MKMSEFVEVLKHYAPPFSTEDPELYADGKEVMSIAVTQETKSGALQIEFNTKAAE
jgi:hypothetical protein